MTLSISTKPSLLLSNPLQSKYLCFSRKILSYIVLSPTSLCKCPSSVTLEFRTTFAVLLHNSSCRRGKRKWLKRIFTAPPSSWESCVPTGWSEQVIRANSESLCLHIHKEHHLYLFSLFVKMLLNVHRRGYSLKQELRQREKERRVFNKKTTETKSTQSCFQIFSFFSKTLQYMKTKNRLNPGVRSVAWTSTICTTWDPVKDVGSQAPA